MNRNQIDTDSAHRVEDYPLSPVPAGARKDFVSTLWVLLGFTFFTATMWAGGTIGASFPFWPDLVVIICLGNAILGAYVALLGVVAQRTGLTSVLLAREAFGTWGKRRKTAESWE